MSARQRLEVCGHQCSGAHLFVAEFRMLMNVTSPGDHFGHHGGEPGFDFPQQVVGRC
jgi:hypothetical protein